MQWLQYGFCNVDVVISLEKTKQQQLIVVEKVLKKQQQISTILFLKST